MLKTQLALVLIVVVVVGTLTVADPDADDALCRKYARQDGFTDKQLANIGPMNLVSSVGWDCEPGHCCRGICETMYKNFGLEVENNTACCCGIRDA